MLKYLSSFILIKLCALILIYRTLEQVTIGLDLAHTKAFRNTTKIKLKVKPMAKQKPYEL